tara:strand:+ start:374 stop:556 length:183 start_codon:yes stop_codon:yes gene_type:complete
MGLAALGVGPGYELNVYDIFWIVTASTTINLGTALAFVDIVAKNWGIYPERAREATRGAV